MANVWETKAHAALQEHAKRLQKSHLRELTKDEKRNEKLYFEDVKLGLGLDFCRSLIDEKAYEALFELAKETHLKKKIEAMFNGEKINTSENRAVLHVALRAPPSEKIVVDGKNVVEDVHDVLKRISEFTKKVRDGEWLGHTGKKLTDVICVGIGGSYLGPEFVFEALRTDKTAGPKALGRRLRFLANVDPIDVARAVEGFCPETTLVVVISKTFTTAETMLNARTLRHWLLATLKAPEAVAKHMVAVSTNLKLTSDFGIDSNNVFGFWDWVGGRFSVCSAVGVLPLALHYGYDVAKAFLEGCHEMDKHFQTAPLEKNLPVLTGLLSVWNSTYLGHGSVAVLPYCQALLRFAAHIQQLTMESNGKRVTKDNKILPFDAGEIYFGEPGTNGQHSFYQLLHQGRVVPAEFIGFVKSQHEIGYPGEVVKNHDELMSNFFAQPDALALGKTAEQCRAEGVPENLVEQKVFPGNRPSTMLLMPECTARSLGHLLSLYENRTAVQGFIWGVNSFDQWGVELGKVLATTVRKYLHEERTSNKTEAEKIAANIPVATRRFLKYFVEHSQ